MPYLGGIRAVPGRHAGHVRYHDAALAARAGRDWLLPLLAFPAVFWTIGLGQNAFLNAALFGGFTLLLDRRPLSAGMLLGVLCYKPHFGLLAPVALHRRPAVAGAFAGAAITVAVAGRASVALFGWGTWTAYLTAFSHSDRGVCDRCDRFRRHGHAVRRRTAARRAA